MIASRPTIATAVSFGSTIAFDTSEWHRAHLFSFRENQRILRHNSNDPPIEAGVPVAKDTLASSPQQKRNCLTARIVIVRSVVVVTALGLMAILIALSALSCILAIRDLVKLAKHRKTRPDSLHESRPVFVRSQPISNLINEDA